MRVRHESTLNGRSVFEFFLGDVYLREALGDEEQRQIVDEEDAATTDTPSLLRHQLAGHQSGQRQQTHSVGTDVEQ